MSFCNLMKTPITTKNTIVELFRIFRNSIRKYYHKKLNETMLGMEPDEGGVGRIEIDESELIGRENQILLMFGLIDRKNKDARVFCVMENRRKENLLPIICNNVYTPNFVEGGLDLRTRIYSDCFSVYRENDFDSLGYVLHRVNHSVWFGLVHIRTNTIEGLRSCLERLSNHFSGLNFNLLENLAKKGVNAVDYLNSWICYCLFLRDCERKKSAENQQKQFLFDIIKNS